MEDRLRNDWLLELGRRRDWKNFALDFPRFRMNDDREVTCYSILTEYQAGRDVKANARATWLAQKDGDDGCNLLATTLFEARKLSPADVWLKLRLSVEANKPRAIKQAGALLGKPTLAALTALQDSAGKFLNRRVASAARVQQELDTLALIRVAGSDPAQAAELMTSKWEKRLPTELGAWVWAQIGRQSALRLQTEAMSHYQRALKLQGDHAIEWSEDTLAWGARAALRVASPAAMPSCCRPSNAWGRRSSARTPGSTGAPMPSWVARPPANPAKRCARRPAPACNPWPRP